MYEPERERGINLSPLSKDLTPIFLWGLWRYMPEPIGQTKKNGEVILRMQFSAKEFCNTYKLLLTNMVFCFAALAIGTVGIPCLAWIALAPVIMTIDGHLTVIEYGLWQLPVFGATILGNWFLHHLTYKYEIKPIIIWGSVIMLVGTILTSALPYFFGNKYYYLLPGMIIYFFALSIVNAPLNRYCLYVTSVTKGTASALISLSVMIVGAVGIEIANVLYENHSNLNFGLFCNGVQLFYFLFIGLAFAFHKEKIDY